MQNALAILQFPLIPAQPIQPDLATPTQDFAESFAAELPEVLVDTSSADPKGTPPDQAVAWVVPMLPPAVMPIGLEVATEADVAAVEQTMPLQVAAPDVPQVVVQSPTVTPSTPPDVTTDSPNTVDFGGSRPTDVIATRALEETVAPTPTATETVTRSEWFAKVGSSTAIPPEDNKAEVPGPQAKVSHQTGQAASPEPADAPVGPATRVIAQAVAPALVAVAQASVIDPTPPEQAFASSPPLPGYTASPMADLRVVAPPAEPVPVGPPPPTPLIPANVATTNGPASDMGPATPPEGDTVPAPTADVTRQADQPVADAAVLADTTTEPTAPPEKASPEPKTLSSFWERFFTAGSQPLVVSRELPEPSVAEPADPVQPTDRVQSVIRALPLVLPGMDRLEELNADSDELSVAHPAEKDAGIEVTSTAPATAPSLPQGPTVRLDVAPAVVVLPWTDDTADTLDPDVTPLSSLPVPSSASTPVATSGPAASLALPVQQVALQLAGVLVQANDRVTELALAPEELGKVRLRMEPDATNPDRLTIMISVERPETLDLFRRHAGELAEAIRNAGYSGAQIDFGRQGQGGDGQQNARPHHRTDLATDEVGPIPYAPRIMAGATLDLRL